MEPVPLLCILIGALIIASRAPLIFAPQATMRVYERLLATPGRTRAMGAGLAVLASALVLLPPGGALAGDLLRLLGVVIAAPALWLLAAPGSFARVARAVFAFIDGSVDLALVRIVGVLASALGAALIYAGLYLV